LADKQTLIIVLADVHWIDPSTLELVNKIIPLIRTVRVLFLIKFRPEFMPPWLGKPHVTMITLDRMGYEQSLAMIAEVAGDNKLPLKAPGANHRQGGKSIRKQRVSSLQPAVNWLTPGRRLSVTGERILDQ
jgi:hypothetical protein